MRSAFTRECYEHGMRLVLLLALVACGASQARTERPSESCEPDPPTGSPALYSPGESEGVVAFPAEGCSEGHYIRVERAEGSRAIVMGRAEGGGLAGCETPAPDCERVQADAFYTAVHEVLQAENIETIGIGLGPCGDIQGDYDAWRFSLALHDWAHVDRAVEVMGELLRQWDIQGHAGVAIRDIPCGVALEAQAAFDSIARAAHLERVSASSSTARPRPPPARASARPVPRHGRRPSAGRSNRRSRAARASRSPSRSPG